MQEISEEKEISAIWFAPVPIGFASLDWLPVHMGDHPGPLWTLSARYDRSDHMETVSRYFH